MKTFISWWLLLSWLWPVNIHAQIVYTLQDCIEKALLNNERVRNSTNNTALALINQKQSYTALIPGTSVNFQHGLNQGRGIDPATNLYIQQQYSYGNQGLSASITLFQGLGKLRNIRQQSVSYEASRWDEQSVKDQVILDVLLVYTQALTAADLQKQAQIQQQLTNEQLERINTLHDKGAVMPGSYFDLLGQLSNDRVLLTDAENAYQNALVSLCELMNIPYDNTISIAAVDTGIVAVAETVSAEKLYASASENLGLIKSADLWKESAVWKIKINKSLYFPTLSIGAGMSSNYSSNAELPFPEQSKNNLGKAVFLSLNIPVTSYFNTRHEVSKAKVQLLNAEVRAQSSRNQLQQLTHQALINQKSALEKYSFYNHQTDAYQESYRIAEVRYAAGAITSVEYLTIKNNYDRANLQKIMTRYEVILRNRIIAYYLGKTL